MAESQIVQKVQEMLNEEKWTRASLSAYSASNLKELDALAQEASREKIIDEVLAKESGKVEEYRSGKDKLFGFFVGQVMQASKGKANPGVVNEILLKKLKG